MPRNEGPPIHPDQLTIYDLIGPEPRARPSDPVTSHEAAKVANRDLVARKNEILMAYAYYGAMTDEDLRIVLLRRHHRSESGPRSRRAELVDVHLVEKVGYGTNSNGNRAILWDLSQEGRNYLEEQGLWIFRTYPH